MERCEDLMLVEMSTSNLNREIIPGGKATLVEHQNWHVTLSSPFSYFIPTLGWTINTRKLSEKETQAHRMASQQENLNF